jgi:redox-sensitive bicupin YhaK (pirin superfamily)
VIGPEGGEVVMVHQDASVHVGALDAGVELTHPIVPGHGAYAFLISGACMFDDESLATGDAAKVTDQPELRIRATEASELILVDVPMTFEAVGVWKGRV